MVAAASEPPEESFRTATLLAQGKRLPPVPKMLHSEVVDGILLDRRAARGRMREILHAWNIAAEVAD
eukprot:10443334-Prorocentrum_lima.AAC.1